MKLGELDPTKELLLVITYIFWIGQGPAAAATATANILNLIKIIDVFTGRTASLSSAHSVCCLHGTCGRMHRLGFTTRNLSCLLLLLLIG